MAIRASTLIWDYYSKVQGDDKRALCNQCSKELSYKTSITNLKTHLKIKHIGHYNSFMAECQPIPPRVERVVPPTPNEVLDPQPSTSTESHKIVSQTKISSFTRVKRPLRTDEKKQIDAMLFKLIARTFQPF